MSTFSAGRLHDRENRWFPVSISLKPFHWILNVDNATVQTTNSCHNRKLLESHVIIELSFHHSIDDKILNHKNVKLQ